MPQEIPLGIDKNFNPVFEGDFVKNVDTGEVVRACFKFDSSELGNTGGTLSRYIYPQNLNRCEKLFHYHTIKDHTHYLEKSSFLKITSEICHDKLLLVQICKDLNKQIPLKKKPWYVRWFVSNR